MPIEVWYILALLLVVGVTFAFLKRPIYECMFYGYILMLILCGEFKNFFVYIEKTSTDTLFYAIICFLVLAKILDVTHAVDTIVSMLISAFGRVRGGAGYAAVIGSSFMGALSGSGAGNVAATGVFTIPAMKKSKFPSHLAANVECAASSLGNMIPPSGVILTALACYNEFSGQEMSQSTFWFAMWGVALWFIVQRLVTVYVFCKVYKVEPLKKEELPDAKKMFKEGWKNLLLPVIILLPFVLDSMFKTTLFADRLGTGASNLSSCLLLITPGIAAVYALIVNRDKIKGKSLPNLIKDSVSGVVPVGATIFFAYCISNLFSATNVGTEIGEYIQGFDIPLVGLAFIIPLITAVLGMVLPGSAQTKIFGGTFISIFAAAGGDPLLAAIMLPVITGAMEGMTPPLALCMYTAMGIAESDMKETTANCFIWIVLHYLMSVLCLLGLLPILGL